jgi:predicted ribosomally synthesized peptide with nif11-like leader
MTTPTDNNAAAFIERIFSDEQFQKSYEDFSATSDDVPAFAKAQGYQFTKEEFLAAWEAKFGKLRNEDGSLTEEALEGVSGGFVGLITRLGPAAIRVGGSLLKWAGIGLGLSTAVKGTEEAFE